MPPQSDSETYSLSYDLLFDVVGDEDWKVQVTATITCEVDCSYDDGSSGELEGVGSFGIEGDFGDDGGLITLRGKNSMLIDLAEDDLGCVSVSVEGVDSVVCP